MAETPRTQVEEPRFGVSIQPTADPVDRTIIARAPQITADPYMNAWSEIARDFAAGYGALKKAQVEADIPMGEQYYLESGVDGLFADGKDEQAAMAALVRNGELAEEHSIGTRIGFERASGRSAAYREREKLSAALTEMISGARELDPQTGLPKLATAQDIDDAITRIRGESYAKYTQDPNFAWFKNSPYAAEEYNKLMRTYTPELAAQFKEKARENLTEHRRVLLMDELVNKAASLGSKPMISMDEFDSFNDFVFNNVVIGGIPNPQQFMAQAFQVAGIKILNDNPQGNQVGLMNQFIDRVNAYRDPKTGTKIQGLFWEKTKDVLRTEANQRAAQNTLDKRKILEARYTEEFAKGTDPKSYVAQARAIIKESKQPGANPDYLLSKLRRLTSERIAADLASPDSSGAYSTELFTSLYNTFAPILDGEIKADKDEDDAYNDLALRLALSGRFDDAVKKAASILDPDAQIATQDKIAKIRDSKANEYLKDPTVIARMRVFKKTASILPLGELDEAPSTIVPRSAIGNKNLEARTKLSFDDDNTQFMESVANIASNRNLTEQQKIGEIRRVLDDLIANRSKVVQAANDKFVELEKKISENESKFQSSAALIAEAYDRKIIDNDSFNLLMKSEEDLQKRVTPPIGIFEKLITQQLEANLVNPDEVNGFPKFYLDVGAQAKYFDKNGKEQVRFILSDKGEVLVRNIANEISRVWVQAYTEGRTKELKDLYALDFDVVTDPKILRQASVDFVNNAAIRRIVDVAIDHYKNDTPLPQLGQTEIGAALSVDRQIREGALPGLRPAEASASRPAEMPASRPAEAPASRPMEAPASRPAEAPASRPMEAPASRPATESASVEMAAPIGPPAKGVVPAPGQMEYNLGIDPTEYIPYVNALNRNADQIAETLKISSDEMEDFAILAAAISLQETRGGDDTIMRRVSGIPIPAYTADKLGFGKSTGITQINEEELFRDPHLVRNLEALGITRENYNPWNPDMQAKATVAFLHNIKKSALANLKKNKKNNQNLTFPEYMYYQYTGPGLLVRGKAQGERISVANVKRYFNVLKANQLNQKMQVNLEGTQYPVPENKLDTTRFFSR
jgi:hypothetical protein